jgi:hypothetical protein
MKYCAALAFLTSIAVSPPCMADPMELSAFVALARPEPTVQVSYGEAPSKAIDVFLPSGPGPHPVAILSTAVAGKISRAQGGSSFATSGRS